MAEEEKTVAPEGNPADITPSETPSIESAPAETTPADNAPTDDGGNFGEADADNFGGNVEEASGFEDNFGLGDQQLSAGTIPSPPPVPKKKEGV